MTSATAGTTRSDDRVEAPEREQRSVPRPRATTLIGALAALVALVAVQAPSLRAGFWSWDWYWLDQDARGQTAWGGPFYDVLHHQNPLPAEVAWYRLTLAVLGSHPTAQHQLTLAGFLITLGLLYAYLRLLTVPRWAAAAAVTLAGLAPSSQSSWTWFASSPHMWAAALGLGAAITHLAWRRGGSRSWQLIVGAAVLALLAVAMKNDGVLGPLLILAWEWTAFRAPGKSPKRRVVTVMALLPLTAFLWWQATAIDPHRDSASTGAGHVLSTMAGLLRFTFLTRTEAELRQEFPPGPQAPTALLLAAAVVGASILALAAFSLQTRSGRTLVLAGVGALGPVSVLQPALVCRYVLPAVLMFTGAAAVGASVLLTWDHGSRRPHGPALRAVGLAALLASAVVWGTLAHRSSGDGEVAVREENALLTGLQSAHLNPQQGVALQLLGSPLNPTTAQLRLLDPALPRDPRLPPIQILGPGQTVTGYLHLITVIRDDSGRYAVQ
jgi:hypothetical protein